MDINKNTSAGSASSAVKYKKRSACMNTIIKTTLVTMVISASSICAEKNTDDEARRLRLEIEQVKKENLKLDREIARVDSLKAEENARFAEMKKNRTLVLERRRAEITELKVKMQEINSQIQQEKSTQAGFKNKIDEQSAMQKALVKSLINYCQILEEEIANTLPWDLEIRKERVRILKRDLEAGTATLEEGFNRFNALYTQEIQSGDEVAVFDRPVTRNNGEIINAQVLKIGNQWLVYLDEEGKKYGIMQRKKTEKGITYAWREDLSFKEREAVREALEVKTAKKPPKLVTLPLTLTLEYEDRVKGGE
jgi:hypothetical protein